MEPLLVYYSSPTLNTHRFAQSIGIETRRIPISMKETMESPDRPYVLMTPTYADDDGSKAVPKQVIRFLNSPENREPLIGVIGGGNRNFGELFAHSAAVIAKKCNVPLLYKFELSGTPQDTDNVKNGVRRLWESLKQTTQQKNTGT